MILRRLLRRRRPLPTVVRHYSPAAYLAARSAGRGLVRVELPLPPHPAAPPLLPRAAGACAPAADLGRGAFVEEPGE